MLSSWEGAEAFDTDKIFAKQIKVAINSNRGILTCSNTIYLVLS